jgi:hypothetical protein
MKNKELIDKLKLIAEEHVFADGEAEQDLLPDYDYKQHCLDLGFWDMAEIGEKFGRALLARELLDDMKIPWKKEMSEDLAYELDPNDSNLRCADCNVKGYYENITKLNCCYCGDK